MADKPKDSNANDDIAAYAALSLAALFWAGNFIAGRAIGGRIDPLEINTLRWSICIVLLLPFTAQRIVRHRHALRREWRLVGLLGLTGIAAFHVMIYQALRLTPAVNALLILAITPVTIAVAGALNDGFRPSRRQALGLAVSLIGAGMLILGGDGVVPSLRRIDAGKVWMIGAILVWTWYCLLLRRRPADLPQDVTLAASVIVALAVLVPALLVFGIVPVMPTLPLAAAVLYIAVFASLAGFLLWSHGVTRIGPERAGQFIHLMPLFGTAMAVVFLGERLAAHHLAGAICVLAGILLVSRRGTPVPVRARERSGNA